MPGTRGGQGLVEPLVLVTPGIALLFGAFLFPVGQILVLSVAPSGEEMGAWRNFARFFADDYYLRVAWRTFRLSLLITAATALIGFPLAYAMARAPRWLAFLLLLLTVLPLMTSVVVRTFGWMMVLGRGGPVTDLLMLFGLSARNAVLLQSETGIVVAMVQVLLPFMVLTTLGVIAGIHPHLEEAARTMGAGFYRTLRHVVLPPRAPGLVSGSLLVFAISMSSFITPNLIGGVRLPVMASAIYQQAIHTLDWGFAAAQSTLLLVAVLGLLVPYLALMRRARV